MNTLQAMNITVYWKFALRKTRLRLYMPLGDTLKTTEYLKIFKMKRFILIIIFFVSINITFGQTQNYDGIVAHQIWGLGHTISNNGEENFLALYPENIKPLPEN